MIEGSVTGIGVVAGALEADPAYLGLIEEFELVGKVGSYVRGGVFAMLVGKVYACERG
jgi:hypothetical protein